MHCAPASATPPTAGAKPRSNVVPEPSGTEFIVAAFTVILALATIALALATQKLWQSTQLLANKTQQDFERRRAQETVTAWEHVRDLIPPGGLPYLSAQSQVPEEIRPVLRKVEYFGACINADIYDLQIFSRLSGNWFLQQYARVQGYVESRANPRAYADLKELRAKVHRAGAGGGVLPLDDSDAS